MLTTIRLYGELGRTFGRVHKFAVDSAAEAVQALCTMIPGFEKHLTNSKDRGVGYSVFYGKLNLSEEALAFPSNGSDIRIAPVLMGSKKSGWLNIIVGAVLIIAGVFTSWAGGTALISAGIGMIAGGVVQLLTPVPKGRSTKDKPDNQASYSFNGPVNTQAQGNPVSALYGELIIGSAVVSAGISAQDMAIVPSRDRRSGSGGGGSTYRSVVNAE